MTNSFSHMKTQITALFVLTLGGLVPSANSQSTFQNLGFEAPVLPLDSGNPPYVAFASAFPGWSGYIGGEPVSLAVHNAVAMDNSSLALIGSNVTFFPGPTVGVIAGQYSAVLQAGVDGLTFTPADTTLAQTGLVPPTAQSLRFRAFGPSGFGPLTVSLGGQVLVLNAESIGPDFTLFAADIRPWQGQTAELNFTLRAQRPHINNNNLVLDSIDFSNSPVPEPSGLVQLAVGGAVLLLVRCRFTKRLRL